MAEPTIEELQAKLAEANKAAERVAFLEAESKKAFAERDEAKKKAREFEEAEQKRKASELSEVEKAKQEAEALRLKLAEVEPELERGRAFLKAEKDALLAKLPEDQRERWSKVDDLALLKDHVSAHEKKEPNPPKKPGAGEQPNPFESKTLNLTEQARIKRENPKEAERLKALANK